MTTSESALRETVLQECDAGLIATDSNGRILFWNAASERLLGIGARETIGQPLVAFVRPELSPENLHFLEGIARRTEVPPQPMLCHSPQGGVRSVLASVRSRGEISVLTLERLPAHEGPFPEGAASRTGRHSVAKRVISYLSHEVRIPLAAILGFAEMMYDAKQTVTERMNCISRIRNNVKHLTELMDDISDLSQIESGDLRLQPVTFSLLPELGEIFSLLQTHAWKKRLELRVQFPGPVPEAVHLDASRLRQILFNVVGELIEETARGTITIEVEMREAGGQMTLVFRVRGPVRAAIAGDANERFEPFPRGDDRSGLLLGGNRLGLALARRLARLLGGDVQSNPESGGRSSSYTITVQAGPSAGVRRVAKVADSDLKVRDSSLFTATASPLEGMHVLLVEDSPDIQILIRHFLKKFGAQVDLAENGEEGLNKARSGAFDAILMDLQLPMMNGIEATQALRRAGQRTPVIALTAHAMSDVRDKCLSAGFDEYMTKPIHASALIDALQKYHRGKPASAVLPRK